MKRVLLALSIVCAALGVFLFGKTLSESHKAYVVGEEAKQSFTYKALLPPPPQTGTAYPVIHESRGMFDFSAVALYEADADWVESIRETYQLTPAPDAHELSSVISLLRHRKLDDMAELLSQETWSRYTGGRLSGVRFQDPFTACFDLYVNQASSKVILYYHSFTHDQA